MLYSPHSPYTILHDTKFKTHECPKQLAKMTMRANAQLVQKVAAAQVPDLKHHMMGPGGNLSLPREGRSQSLKINSENNFIRRGTEIIKLKVLQKKKDLK